MSKGKEVFGSLEFTYSTLVMPLEVAQQVQALLAKHAIKVDGIYCGSRNPPIYAEVAYEVSPVSVAKKPDFDCKGINPSVLNEWRNIVADREAGAPVMDPHDFEKLKGEPT